MYSEIILNSSSNLFPGGDVQGKVVMVPEFRVDVNGIKIKLRGQENTSWTAEDEHYDFATGKTMHSMVHFEGENKFLNLQQVLTGTIDPGTKEYPFHFSLPYQLPSSFVSQNGQVRYYISLIVEQPNKFPDKKEKVFHLAAPIDFNTMPGLVMAPTRYQDTNNLECCCIPQGAVTMTLHLDKEAYVLGEMMRFRVQVLNMSSEDVSSLNVKLKMIIQEMTTAPRPANKTTEHLLTELRRNGVSASCDRTYDLSLLVPRQVNLPNFNSCLLFQMWGLLVVEAEPNVVHDPVSLRIKIALGHIPKITAGFPGASDKVIRPFGTNDFSLSLLEKTDIPKVHKPMTMPMPMPILGDPPYPIEKSGSSNKHSYPPGWSINPCPPGFSIAFSPDLSSTPYPSISSAPYPPEQSYRKESSSTRLSSVPFSAPYPYGPSLAPYPVVEPLTSTPGKSSGFCRPEASSTPYPYKSSAPYPPEQSYRKESSSTGLSSVPFSAPYPSGPSLAPYPVVEHSISIPGKSSGFYPPETSSIPSPLTSILSPIFEPTTNRPYPPEQTLTYSGTSPPLYPSRPSRIGQPQGKNPSPMQVPLAEEEEFELAK